MLAAAPPTRSAWCARGCAACKAARLKPPERTAVGAVGRAFRFALRALCGTGARLRRLRRRRPTPPCFSGRGAGSRRRAARQPHDDGGQSSPTAAPQQEATADEASPPASPPPQAQPVLLRFEAMLDVSQSARVTASPDATVAAVIRALGPSLPEAVYASLRGRRLDANASLAACGFVNGDMLHLFTVRSRAAASSDAEQLGGGDAADDSAIRRA
jgi:hypothetical protein